MRKLGDDTNFVTDTRTQPFIVKDGCKIIFIEMKIDAQCLKTEQLVKSRS